MKRKYKILSLIVVFAVGISVYGFNRYSDVYFQIKKNFSIFSEAYKEVTLRYVDKMDPGQLMETALKAMLDSLDPYTVMIDQSKHEKLDIMTTGQYGGVGIEVGSKGDKIVVIAPLEGYPAYEKGIRAGDVILSVNGMEVGDYTPEEVHDIIRGEPGSSVTLTLSRYGVEQDLDFELTRENIKVNNVAYSGLIGPQKQIGYILLNRFSQNASVEVRNAIKKLKEKSELSGLIIDLRNNPGGLLSEAVQIVDKFINPGIKIVETKGRIEKHNQVYKSDEPAMAGNIPLFVLQNSGSASASEVVSGALQDLDRAVIIGEKSFGKGLVQVVRSLPYNMALKLTTSKYYTPSGRSIQSVTYTHNSENNGVHTPDSAKKAFKTRAGRTVYDSQGIIPDIEIDEKKESILEIALMKNSSYFFFANQFASGKDSLRHKNVTDSVYRRFRSFLEKRDFSFSTETEKQLQKLKGLLEKKGMVSDVRTSVKQLSSLIEEEKKQMFREEEEDIKRKLYLELILRYSGKQGRIEKSIRFDPYVQKGVEIALDSGQYNSILTPN